MAPTERPHTAWLQRLCAFHRAVLKLHMRRFRRLAQYRFVHAVWVIPLVGLLGPLNVHANYWASWIVATAAWLSLVWRVPLDDSADKLIVLLPWAWWPHYNRAVSVGILVCLILMALPLIATTSVDTPVGAFVPILRGTLMEASACALILSAIYHFFFGYLVGIMRLTWVWPRRVNRRHMRRGSAGRDERKSTWVTKPHFYLVILLSISGLFLTAAWPPSVSELLFLLFVSFLPTMFFRSPWLGAAGVPWWRFCRTPISSGRLDL